MSDKIENLATSNESREAVENARLAELFANGKLNQHDAYDMMYRLQHIIGEFTLESFSVEDTIVRAQSRWSNPESDFRKYVKDACARVWGKWSSLGEIESEAQDWALDLVREYATEDGINLVDKTREDDE